MVRFRGKYLLRFICILRIAPAVIIFLMTVSGSDGGDIPKSPEGEQPGKPFSVKVNVDLVPVNVTVWGKDVPELRAEDFTLYDNNKSQEISYFSRNQIPIAIALLVDCSGSLKNHMFDLEIAALSALQKLNPEDPVALYSICGKFKPSAQILLDPRPSLSSLICKNTRLNDLTTDRLEIVKKSVIYGVEELRIYMEHSMMQHAI